MIKYGIVSEEWTNPEPPDDAEQPVEQLPTDLADDGCARLAKVAAGCTPPLIVTAEYTPAAMQIFRPR